MAEDPKQKTTKEFKFPTEIIDLPSRGKIYPEDSPLRSGQVELKYMTTREEDILTSQNLIKKGVVIDRLLESLIVTKGVRCENLILGDKNAVMVAARILAYGPEYVCEVINPSTGEKSQESFNLADCPFRELPKEIDYSKNEFEMKLSASKAKITFKILTGADEKLIENELKSLQKIKQTIVPELTTRLKHVVTSVNGESKIIVIKDFVENMLSRDSMELRAELSRISPDIILSQNVEIEGEQVEVAIPLTANFFWPNPEKQI